MTPLQKFIELIKKHDLDDEMLPFTRNDMIIRIAESLLEMEKERIEKDYMSGYSNGGLGTCITPQQYYEHIYGGKNEQ
jgi:hypothetical protein